MIFTTHVVDWQQSVLDHSHSISNQVWQHTIMMLEILHTNDISATFFIQDKVAFKYPVLVRKILSAGHEIGCYIDTPYNKDSFHQVAENNIRALEDISGKKVIGTRCQGLSLAHTDFDNFCQVLRNLGIQYDSSLITNQSIHDLQKKNASLDAFRTYGISQYPLSVLKLKLSFGGSAFRLCPYELTYTLSSRLDRDTAVFQIPIYDLGVNEQVSLKNTHDLHWHRKLDFWGRKSIPVKLQKLFADYPFDSFKNYYFEGYAG